MTQPLDAYILRVNETAVEVFDTFDLATRSATKYMDSKPTLNILHSPSNITTTREWNFDYEIGKWVEFVRP